MSITYPDQPEAIIRITFATLSPELRAKANRLWLAQMEAGEPVDLETIAAAVAAVEDENEIISATRWLDRAGVPTFLQDRTLTLSERVAWLAGAYESARRAVDYLTVIEPLEASRA